MLLEVKSYWDKLCKRLGQIQVSQTRSFLGETLEYQIKKENKKKKKPSSSPPVSLVQCMLKCVGIWYWQKNSNASENSRNDTHRRSIGNIALKTRYTYKDKEPWTTERPRALPAGRLCERRNRIWNCRGERRLSPWRWSKATTTPKWLK